MKSELKFPHSKSLQNFVGSNKTHVQIRVPTVNATKEPSATKNPPRTAFTGE
jgi:hypothetical protein